MTSSEFYLKRAELLKDVNEILADVLLAQAYERGHSGGYEEVLNILSGLVYDFREVNALLLK